MSAATDNAVVDAVDSLLGVVAGRVGMGAGADQVSGGESTFVDWIKAILRKEWRFQCLDLVVRL
jgi:hypothetical protein